MNQCLQLHRFVAHIRETLAAGLLPLALVVLPSEQIDLLLYLVLVLAERLPLALVGGRRLGRVVFFRVVGIDKH